MSHFPGPVPRGKSLNLGNNARNAAVSRGGIRADLQLNRLLIRMLGVNSVWVVSIGRCTVRVWGDSCRKSKDGHQTQLVSAAYPIVPSDYPCHRRNRELILTHVIRAAPWMSMSAITSDTLVSLGCCRSCLRRTPLFLLQRGNYTVEPKCKKNCDRRNMQHLINWDRFSSGIM